MRFKTLLHPDAPTAGPSSAPGAAAPSAASASPPIAPPTPPTPPPQSAANAVDTKASAYDPDDVRRAAEQAAERRFGELQSKRDAELSHQRDYDDSRKVFDTAIDEILGDLKEKDKFVYTAVRRSVMADLDDARELYPQGHHLAGMLKPHSAESIKAAIEKNKLADQIKEWRGAQLSAIGRGTRSVAPAVNNQRTGQGKGEDLTPQEQAEAESRDRRMKLKDRFAKAGLPDHGVASE